MLIYLWLEAVVKIYSKPADVLNRLLYALAHRQVLEFVFDPFGRLSLRFPEQLQIIVGHQARQIWFSILVLDVFFELHLRNQRWHELLSSYFILPI